MTRKRKIKISVDNVPFDSVAEVAQLCDIKRATLYWCLSHNDKVKTVNGYKLECLGDHTFNLTKTDKSTTKESRHAVKVKCLETGKVYPSIGAIAKKLGVNMWTMSVKMEETGKFIDKQGNSYVRLSPMIKRVDHGYGFTTSSITRDIQRKQVEVSKTSVPVKSTVTIHDTIIQSLVKSASLLTDTRNYAQAAQVLNILNDFDK